ncbi:MAG: winged helix-turn-helix transcriptional regulator [Oscillospiraceae bacterium]|nr:winged helix-turn-helix transcriptional regulator [Oscillospiraceae bacterium]
MGESGFRYHDYVQLNKGMDRLYHDVAAAFGMPDSVLSLFLALWEEGEGRTPTQLYGEWSLSKQTGHSALSWLERRGLIRLAPAPDSRRSKGVFLTDRGREFGRGTVVPLLAAEEAAFGGLSEGEQRTLLTLTERMLCKLKEETAGLSFPARETL